VCFYQRQPIWNTCNPQRSSCMLNRR